MRPTHAYRCAIALASGALLTLAVGAHASADELIPGPQPDAWACVGSSQEATSYAVLLRTDAAPLFADGAEVTLDATVSESSIADVTVTVSDGTIILPDDWTSLAPVPSPDPGGPIIPSPHPSRSPDYGWVHVDYTVRVEGVAIGTDDLEISFTATPEGEWAWPLVVEVRDCPTPGATDLPAVTDGPGVPTPPATSTAAGAPGGNPIPYAFMLLVVVATVAVVAASSVGRLRSRRM